MMPNSTRVVNQKIAVGTSAAVTIGAETFPTTDPVTLAAIPGSGGTMIVTYQVAPDGTWHNWPAGTVSTTTVYVLSAPVYALKFTAATQPGVVELAQ